MPRSAYFHLRDPERTTGIVPYLLTFAGKPRCIVSSAATANLPIGVGNGKVTSVGHIVCMSEIVVHPTEVRGLRRTDASAAAEEVRRNGGAVPGIYGTATSTFVRGMLLGVFRLVNGESGR